MSTLAARSPMEPITRKADAASLCTDLEEVVARMTDLMDRETALLADNRHREILDLQGEKTELSRRFLKQFTAFKANAAFIGAKVPSQADRLRRALRAFGKCLERNLNAVDAARAVSQGIVQAMFDAAKKANAGPTCYGSNAAMGPDTSSRPTALTLDRSL